MVRAQVNGNERHARYARQFNLDLVETSITKASDIFHLIQYLKTEIKQEKRNSGKKTVSTYITKELRSSNICVLNR